MKNESRTRGIVSSKKLLFHNRKCPSHVIKLWAWCTVAVQLNCIPLVRARKVRWTIIYCHWYYLTRRFPLLTLAYLGQKGPLDYHWYYLTRRFPLLTLAYLGQKGPLDYHWYYLTRRFPLLILAYSQFNLRSNISWKRMVCACHRK